MATTPPAQPGQAGTAPPAGQDPSAVTGVQQALLIMPNQDGTVTVASIDPPPDAAQQGETFKDMNSALDAVEQVFGVSDADDGTGGASDGSAPSDQDDTGPGGPDSETGADAGQTAGEVPVGTASQASVGQRPPPPRRKAPDMMAQGYAAAKRGH